MHVCAQLDFLIDNGLFMYIEEIYKCVTIFHIWGPYHCNFFLLFLFLNFVFLTLFIVLVEVYILYFDSPKK